MKEIQLTKGQVALVDDEDYERINKYKWLAKYDKKMNSYYATRTNYLRENGKLKKENVVMTRFIMNVNDSKIQIDHIVSGDTLNNQKFNLRAATPSQNQQNQRKQRRQKSSKYKGVNWQKRDKKWVSKINFNKTRINLGYFPATEEGEIAAAAAKAYDKKAIELFGEFALLNFPKENYI